MQRVDGFSLYQNQFQQGQGTQAAASESSSGVRQELPQMAKGTVFEGNITEIKDNHVQLRLTNGQSLSAQLEPGVQVRLGEPVLFEVKSNQGGQILLRQVPVNSEYNPTLQKALTAAGMPVNQKNLDLVDSMMKNQMSIGRDSLAAMARQLMRYPGTTVETLIQMQKLGFPVNKESVGQFEAYKAGEHSLLNKFSQVMEQLPELVGGKGGSAEELLKLQNQLLDILEVGAGETGSLSEAAGKGEGIQTLLDGMQAGKDGALLENLLSGTGEGAAGVLGDGAAGAGEGVLPGTGEGAAGILGNGAGDGAAGIPEGGAVGAGEGILPGTGEGAAGVLEGAVPGAEEGSLPGMAGNGSSPETASGTWMNTFLGSAEGKGLEQQLRQLPGMEGDGRLFLDGKLNPELSAKELLSLIRQNLSEGADPSRLKELFQGKAYKSLLKQVMQEQWMLEPQQVAEKENIEHLYERINRQMAKLEEFLQGAGKEGQSMNRQVTQVRGNLEMMNQINQLYNYVQIPLRLHGQNAHSDLYVYTNKKKLQEKDGELSALLHLELDHLGTTDVQIKMKGSNVAADFYLSDEGSFRLVGNYVGELKERLEQKGYHPSVQLERRLPKRDFVKDFLEQEAPVEQLSRYSFDVLT